MDETDKGHDVVLEQAASPPRFRRFSDGISRKETEGQWAKVSMGLDSSSLEIALGYTGESEQRYCCSPYLSVPL